MSFQRMADKPKIRFTFFEILPNILLKDSNDENKATGVIGSLLQNLWERTIYKQFNYSLNWVDDGSGAGTCKNGNCTGLLGMLARDETDSGLVPYGMFVLDGTIKYTTPTNAINGRILNSPQPKTFSVDLLSCFQGFSQSIWNSVLLLAALTFCVVLKLKKQSLFDAAYNTFGLLLNKSFLIIRNLIFQLIVVGMFILCATFAQSMNAELLKKDYTTIIDSISDLERQDEVRPVFIDDGPIVSLFERGASLSYAKLWRRAMKAGSRDLYVFKMNPTEYSRAVRGVDRLALISTEPIVKIAASFGCQKDPKRRSWIARRPLQDTLYAFYTNVNLHQESFGLMDNLAYLIIEGGHADFSWKYAGDNVVKRLLPGASEPLCIKKEIDELFLDSEKVYSIRLSNMMYLLFGSLICLSFAMTALFLERLF